MRRVLILFALAGCSSGPSDSTVPQLGRYQFDTTISGAAYGGTLTITAASSSGVTYTMVMVNGDTETHTSGYDSANGYVLSAHANGWSMIPHLKRSGSTYQCYGNAVFPPTPMSCTWTYLGP
jgi:hypothetical protein